MKHQAPSRLVLIQSIETGWTKRSRGGPAAEARNRVPGVLNLPPSLPGPPGHEQAQTADVFYHHVSYGEQNHFQAPVWVQWTAHTSHFPDALTPQLHAGGYRIAPLTLASAGSMLEVPFHWEQVRGAPHRYAKKESFALVPGQWEQFRFNARKNEEDTWHYLMYTMNIGYTLSFSPDFFGSSAPLHRIADFADLW